MDIECFHSGAEVMQNGLALEYVGEQFQQVWRRKWLFV